MELWKEIKVLKNKEIITAIPTEFVNAFRNKAETLGMTHRPLAAVCFSLGYRIFKKKGRSPSLPSEPSPVVADQIAEKAAVSKVDEVDSA